MNVLLDTHIILWCLYDPEKLPAAAKAIITDPDNWICYSHISLWECDIKHIKHPDIFEFDARDVDQDCNSAGFVPVALQQRHIFGLARIGEPAGVKHQDPFDRMLMSQAYTDNMVFLTHDMRLEAYGIRNVKYV